MPKYAKIILIVIGVLIVADYIRVQLVDSDSKKGLEPLILNPGDIDTLEAGIDHQFSSITIHDDAILRLVGSKKAFTKLIVEKNLRLYGRIEVGNISLDGKSLAIKESYCIADDESVELENEYLAFSNGGKGGAGGRKEECHRSSCQRLDCFKGGDGIEKSGGCGGRGMSDREVTLCNDNRSCKDAFCYQKDQAGCGQKSKPDKECYSCGFGDKVEKKRITQKSADSPLTHGVGGEGGKMGDHGGMLLIVVKGFLDGKGGTIDLSGGSGKSGKDGESKKYTGGGGGGGGPGGNGGKLMVMVKGNYTLLPRMNVDGGKGGKGGKGGVPHKLYGLEGYKGQDGSAGKQGKSGEAFKYNEALNRWDKVK